MRKILLDAKLIIKRTAGSCRLGGEEVNVSRLWPCIFTADKLFLMKV